MFTSGCSSALFPFYFNFSYHADCLFNILRSNSFKYGKQQDSCLRSLLKFLRNDVVLRAYSPVGIGAVLEQKGRTATCVSHKLNVDDQDYSQTQRESLLLFWAVKRLNKYLFGKISLSLLTMMLQS